MKSFIVAKRPLLPFLLILIFTLQCKRKDEYARPVLMSITPATGAVSDQIVIKGSNLNTAQKISFNQVDFVVDPGTEITTVVPPGASLGINKVTVTTLGGVSDPVSFTVIPSNVTSPVNAPTLIKSIPDNNFVGYPVLINGTDLLGAKVMFNNQEAAIFTNNQTVITISVPNGLSAGVVQIKVITAKGTSNVLNFEVVKPSAGTPPPTLSFGIISPPPPSYVPTISNNWSCGLFATNGDGTFVDLNNASVTGKYQYSFNDKLNYVEYTNAANNETFSGQFSSKFNKPCIREMVLISSKTGKISKCTIDLSNQGVVCEK